MSNKNYLNNDRIIISTLNITSESSKKFTNDRLKWT